MKLHNYKIKDELYYKIPKKVQDTIEIREMNKHGIFKVGKMRFSKTYLFFDTNYSLASDSEQEMILQKYSKLLNALNTNLQVTINNKNRNMETVKDQTLFKMKNDGHDDMRQLYNDIIMGKLKDGKNGIEQQKYFTLSVTKKTFKEAILQFNLIETTLKKAFEDMGSSIIPLDTVERMRILHDFYRIGNEELFNYDYDEFKKAGRDVIDYISPAMLDFKQDHFLMGDKFCRAMYIKDYGSEISDMRITKLTELPGHMILSISATPIPKNVARKAVSGIYTRIEMDIQKEQRANNKQGHFTTDISFNKRSEKQGTEELLNDMKDNGERLFYVTTTIVLIADSKEELELMTDSVISEGDGDDCQIVKHFFRQREALNTTLPLGLIQTEAMRIMQSTTISGLVPFNIQEIYQPSGIYYGINQQSKNIIKGDRRMLINGNGFILSPPGGGKSFMCKGEMSEIQLCTNDDVIVVDPENEYKLVCEEFDGQNINISASTNNYINPFEMYGGRTDDDFINKTQFILSICEQCINAELSPAQKSIISKAMTKTYRDYRQKKTDKSPTMVDFHKELKAINHEVAQDLALQLDIFVEGALNVFSHETNVSLDNRFTVFNIQGLGKQLASLGMFVMLENITTRIEQNKQRGRGTWLYIDEIYLLFEKEYSSDYLFKLWKRIRKNGGFATGITQNVEDMMHSYTARNLLSNSEFIVLFKQSPNDIAAMDGAINISDAQLRYVENSPAGTGLIKFGNVIVPFENRVDKKCYLYKLFNTDPKKEADKEWIEAEEQQESEELSKELQTPGDI